MALVTGSRRMGAQQRKAVAMLLDCRDGHVPPANRVTLLAVGSELTPVQIGVTLRAASGRVRKHQAYVTTLARNIRVQTLQLKAGLPVVVELQLSADGLPRGCAVTVFAGNLQVTVGIRGPAALGVLRPGGGNPQRHQENQQE